MTYTILGQNIQKCNFASYQQYNNLPLNPYSSSAQMAISAYESGTNSPYQVVESSMTAAWNGQSVNSNREIVCSISNSINIQTVNGQDQITPEQTNTCGNPPPNCSIYNETICNSQGNCVQTYNNGIKLASPPPPSCITEYSSLSSYQVCEDGNKITVTPSGGQTLTFSGPAGNMWDKITRVYVCGGNSSGLNLAGVEQTIESASMNGNTINYTYQNPNGGQQTESANLPFSISSNSCPNEVCIVQYPENRSTMFGDQTNRSQVPAGNTVYVTKVETCQQQNGSYVCPVPAGATIKQDCSCDSSLSNNYGFDMTLTTLGAIDQAINQFTCN